MTKYEYEQELELEKVIVEREPTDAEKLTAAYKKLNLKVDLLIEQKRNRQSS